MAAIGIAALWAQLRRDWLIQSTDWFEQVEQRSAELRQHRIQNESGSAITPVVLIAEPNPAEFLACFWAGLLSGWSVVLANAHWGQQEWMSIRSIVHPDVCWPACYTAKFETSDQPKRPTTPESILIPTGGSSGQVKLAHHTWSSLMASAYGFLDYFGSTDSPINAFCVLPVYHVSGLMQAIRVWLSGGQLTLTTLKHLLTPPLQPFSKVEPNTFISLVPTQLTRLLTAGYADWLAQFQAIFLGGAPSWPQLLAEARSHQLPLCLSYGMTETAAMVTALSPADFLQGKNSSGQALPHATIQILQGERVLPAGEIGQVVVRSDAIAKGYFNARSPAFTNHCLHTDDLGYLSATGHLHIVGRASGKIISGGENIYPAEVEAALWATGQVRDVCVLGLPDAEWGEAVTAVYVPAHAHVTKHSIKTALMGKSDSEPANQFTSEPASQCTQLSRYKCPKKWYSVSRLPRNAQGKINRLALMTLLSNE